MAARKNRGAEKGSMPKEWRDKIRASMIANRMMDCFEGKVELTQTQLRAGEALFKRLEPELSRTDNTTTHQNPDGSGLFDKISIEAVKPDGNLKPSDT